MTDDIIIGGDSADIPAATYPATLAEVVRKSSDAFGDFRTWDFLITIDGERHRVGGASSMNTGKKSKGGKWIAALLGRRPEKGENITAELVGKPCLVVVEEDDNGWPKVVNVLPPMTQTTAAVPVAATPTESELPF
jgi:hypothetical protein